MWRCALGAVAVACLFGQQSIQIQKARPSQLPKESGQAPGKVRFNGEIQKVKEQCRSKLIVGADELFESGRADLTPGAEKVLSDLGPMIRKEGVHPVSVDGHTDAAGTQTLSEERARIVENWLESRGYVIAKVTDVHGFGTTKPIASNETPEGRQKNRRVEIVINTCKS
jgi:outer membrane protein OmpA-like peptidoglycan-associated protein